MSHWHAGLEKRARCGKPRGGIEINRLMDKNPSLICSRPALNEDASNLHLKLITQLWGRDWRGSRIPESEAVRRGDGRVLQMPSRARWKGEGALVICVSWDLQEEEDHIITFLPGRRFDKRLKKTDKQTAALSLKALVGSGPNARRGPTYENRAAASETELFHLCARHEAVSPGLPLFWLIRGDRLIRGQHALSTQSQQPAELTHGRWRGKKGRRSANANERRRPRQDFITSWTSSPATNSFRPGLRSATCAATKAEFLFNL